MPPLKITELNHVTFAVTDLEASTRFYRDALGLERIPRPAFSFPGEWFRIGEHQQLHLTAGRPVGPIDGSPRAGHFAMQVADVDATVRYLEGKGVPFRGPVVRPDGARQIFIHSPDGHVIEFCGELP